MHFALFFGLYKVLLFPTIFRRMRHLNQSRRGVKNIKHTNHYELPSVGEIIRKVRSHRGMSQDALAEDAFSSRAMICQIELGQSICQDYLLVSIKRALNIEHLPTSEAGRNEFKKKLYRWYGVIDERKQDEATETRNKLSVIKFLPCDRELNTLFSLFDCKFHLLKNELDVAKQIMDAFEIDGLSDVQMYHYLCNQGVYHVKSKRNQEALDFYLKAHDLINHGLGKNITLYYNIALCYERLGCYSRAAAFLEEACILYSQGQCNLSEFSLYNLLGVCYTCIGVLQRAKMSLDKAYSIVVKCHKENDNIATRTQLGLVYSNYGFMFRMAREWDRAIEYLDKSFEHFDKGSGYYLEALYQKARILVEVNDLLSASSLITDGERMSNGNEVYLMMFDALRRLTNLNDDAAKYLETKSIPYFLDNGLAMITLDYCSILKGRFKKIQDRGFKIRGLEMASKISDVRDELLKGGIIA